MKLPITKSIKKAEQFYDYIDSLEINPVHKSALREAFHDTIQALLKETEKNGINLIIEQGMKNFQQTLIDSIEIEKFKKHTKRMLSIVEDLQEKAPDLVCDDMKEEYQEALHDLSKSGYSYKGIEL